MGEEGGERGCWSHTPGPWSAPGVRRSKGVGGGGVEHTGRWGRKLVLTVGFERGRNGESVRAEEGREGGEIVEMWNESEMDGVWSRKLDNDRMFDEHCWRSTGKQKPQSRHTARQQSPAVLTRLDTPALYQKSPGCTPLH